MSAKRYAVLVQYGATMELHERYKSPAVRDSRKDAQRLGTSEVQSGKATHALVVEVVQDIDS